MKYEFSVTLEDTVCRIRAEQDRFLKKERVPDTAPHNHYSVEFHCVFEGEEYISLPREDRVISVKAGQILLIPRETYHGVRTGEGTVERICFHFLSEPRRGKTDPLGEPFRSLRSPMIFENETALALMEQCKQVKLEKDTPLNRIRQGMLMLNAALQLLSPEKHALQTEGYGAEGDRARWIIEDYLERRFTDPEGLDGLARALYLSRRQTGTLVKKYLGEDFKSAVIRRRMELAEVLLRDPHRALEDIAWHVGYRSYSGFQLCFKSYFGMTPSQKRQLLWEKK